MLLQINKNKKFEQSRHLKLPKREILCSTKSLLSNNGLNPNVKDLINELLSQQPIHLTKEQKSARKLELMLFNYINRVNSILEYLFAKKDPDLEPFKDKERLLKKGNGGDGCSVTAALNLLRLYSGSLGPEYKEILKNFNKSFSFAITILKADLKHGAEFKSLSQAPPLIIYVDNTSTALAPAILIKHFFKNQYAEHYLVQSFKSLFSSQLEGTIFSPLATYRLLKDLENGLPAVGVFKNTINDPAGHAVTILGLVKGPHYESFLNVLNKNSVKQKNYWMNRALFSLDSIKEDIKNPGYFVYYDQNAMKLFKVPIYDALFNTIEFEAVVPNSQFIGQENTHTFTETIEDNLVERKPIT